MGGQGWRQCDCLNAVQHVAHAWGKGAADYTNVTAAAAGSSPLQAEGPNGLKAAVASRLSHLLPGARHLGFGKYHMAQLGRRERVGESQYAWPQNPSCSAQGEALRRSRQERLGLH